MAYIAKFWFFAKSNETDKYPAGPIKSKRKKTQMTSRRILKRALETCVAEAKNK